MMKKIFIAIVLLTAIPFFGQSVESLKSDCQKIYDATYNMDFDKILDYTYPKLFDIIDRESMYQVLDQTFQNEELRIRFVHPNPSFTFSDIKEIDGKKLCIIHYNNAARMIFEEKLSDNEAEKLEESLKGAMTNKKITFEKSRNAFYMEGKETMIAVSDEHTQNKWRFINYDPSQKELLNMMLGEKIVSQLEL